jgi:hypothetical protein
LIDEQYLIDYCKQLRKESGFMVTLAIEKILKQIFKAQEYEDQQYTCCNNHDSIMKYDKQKHDGWYFVEEQYRKKERDLNHINNKEYFEYKPAWSIN